MKASGIFEGFLGNILFAIFSFLIIWVIVKCKKKSIYHIKAPGTLLQGRFYLTSFKGFVLANSNIFKSESGKDIDYSFKYKGFKKGNKYYLFWEKINSEKEDNGFTILDMVKEDEINGVNLYYDSGIKETRPQNFELKKINS